MKKFLILTIALFFSATLFAQQKQRTKTKYFYVVGYEYLPAPSQTTKNSQPIISNVFSTRCKEDYLPIKTGLENEFNDYYKAFLSKQRGFRGLNRMIAFGDFETYDEAEKERRKSIAFYNRDRNSILIKDFTAGCE